MDAGVGDTRAHSQHGVASLDQNNGFSENSSPALSNYATSSFARQNLFSAPRPEQFKTPDKVLKPSELLGTATGKTIQKNVKVASVAASSSSGAGHVSQALTGSYTSSPPRSRLFSVSVMGARNLEMTSITRCLGFLLSPALGL